MRFSSMAGLPGEDEAGPGEQKVIDALSFLLQPDSIELGYTSLATRCGALSLGLMRRPVGASALGRISRQRQHSERPNALSAVDQYAFDIRGRRWSGVERCIVPDAKFGSPIGVMKVHHDIGRIEQDDQVLRQVCHSIDV